MSADPVMDYDPNLVAWPNKAKFQVKLTFGEWRYRAEILIAVRGNIRGFDVIESAVENAYEKLLGDSDYATLNMEDADGNILISEDDEDRGSDWLKDKLLGAVIVTAASISATCGRPKTPPGDANER